MMLPVLDIVPTTARQFSAPRYSLQAFTTRQAALIECPSLLQSFDVPFYLPAVPELFYKQQV